MYIPARSLVSRTRSEKSKRLGFLRARVFAGADVPTAIRVASSRGILACLFFSRADFPPFFLLNVTVLMFRENEPFTVYL